MIQPRSAGPSRTRGRAVWSGWSGWCGSSGGRGLGGFGGLALVAALLASVGVPAAAADKPGAKPAAAAVRPAGAAASAVERGRYVALAADCASCHTTPGAAPYAGGAALNTQFGKIYGPNITPDKATGIGNWTAAEFARALREGKRKDGKLLYPAMPYTNYTQMTDDDVSAVWAYLQTVPAVRRKSLDNTFTFPFNVRAGLGVWQAAFFKPAHFVPSADKGATWNRGAYLTEVLGHCGACHTPRNLAQASEKGRNLTGAKVETWYAPNISNGALSKLNGMDVDALAAYLKTGQTTGNANVFGPMSQVVHDSLARLSDADVRAMAVYLKDQPGNAAQRRPPQTTLTPQQLAAGQQLYADHCSSCHQPDGRGVQGTVPALAGNTAVTAREAQNVATAMLEGFDAQGAWAAMPSFAKLLDDEQIAQVANYVRTAWGNHGQGQATSWQVGRLRQSADVPPGERSALVCPVLPREQLQPALSKGNALLLQSARDSGTLAGVVRDYEKARPRASDTQVISALSTAFCRAVADSGMSRMATSAHMADYAQQVAGLLARGGVAGTGAAAAGKPASAPVAGQ